ncbi:MAG TPA: hypothetical protein DCP08_09570 [Chloroflexi bacterium]|nr:hypothetical protein [Chloroflexota bacterium]
MNKQVLIKLLAALTHRLNRGHKGAGAHPPQEENILFGLAEEIRRTLKPVKPAVPFRKDLRSRLEMIAQKRVVLEPRRRRSWLFFLVAAALGSALSALGFLVYFLSSRLSQRPQRAS